MGDEVAAVDAALARGAALYPGRLASSAGRLFAWGKAGGKGGDALPVPAAAIDKAGDCIYPAACQIAKESGARSGGTSIFLKASVDVGPFCALDRCGRVWAWSGWSPAWPQLPTVLQSGCADCAAGSGFIVTVRVDGTVWMLGKAPAPTSLPDARGDWEQLRWAAAPGTESAAAVRDGDTASETASAPVAVAVDACGGVILVGTADGTLCSCGDGVALGLDSSSGTAALTPLPGLPPVSAFAVGSLHAAAATRRDGSLWTWGDGLSGNLGHGDRKHALQPSQVTLGAPAQGGAPATSSASAAVEGGGGSGDGSCGYSTRVVSVGCTRGQPRPKRLQGSSGNKKKKGGSFEAGQEGPRCHAVTVRTMCFPLFRQNRSIFIGNLGLFGVYFYGLMANA